jgi:hypothetical protein
MSTVFSATAGRAICQAPDKKRHKQKQARQALIAPAAGMGQIIY